MKWDKKPQTLGNHGRLVPPYHFAILGIFLVHLAWMGWRFVRAPSPHQGMTVLVALALIGTALYARLFALAVQDRVIRLEMRLRMHEILPEDLRARMGELTVPQLVGLRFASDGELADLVRVTLDEGLSPGEIKKRVKEWLPDYQRC